MKLRCLSLVVLLCSVFACGSAKPEVAKPGAKVERLSVEDAALDFSVLRGRGGEEIAFGELLAELGNARAVCIGESHSNPHHHWSQLHILRSLLAAHPGVFALGMEMFQRPFQGVLDDYGRGKIDEPTMLSRTLWKERWGFDYRLYKPMVDAAVASGAALLALNTPRELTKKVAKVGVGGLTAEESASLPQLNLENQAHRAWFEAIMAGHPQSHDEGDDTSEQEAAEQMERIYQAQVLWDETMAETAATWLSEAPERRIVILAGNGHCHDSAIVGRLKRRGITASVSIRPVIDDGEGSVGELLAKPNHDYVFVMK